MGLLRDAVKNMNDAGKGLKSADDKATFLWNFIDSQLSLQELDNLLKFRKRLNFIIQKKYQEREAKEKLDKGVVSDVS